MSDMPDRRTPHIACAHAGYDASGYRQPRSLHSITSSARASMVGEMGWSSRRIFGEHRLVYRVSGKGREQRLELAQCRYHY
jgi:hypothetical protein